MAHTDPHGAPAGSATTGHETRDVRLGGAPRFIAVMTALLAVVFAFIWFVTTTWRDRAAVKDVPASPVAARAGDRLPPLPRLQTTPYVDLKAFRDSEAAVLETYGWEDREKGVVRIPVSRAIELIAERGLPAPAVTPAPEPGTTGAATAGARGPR
jgi:hypothetical protein